MEKLILLRANIRKKKSTFISIVILTGIIMSLMAAVFSVRDNFNSSLKKAFISSGSGDITIFFRADSFTDELREKVENSEIVKDVKYSEAIYASIMTVGDYQRESPFFMTEMREGIYLFNKDLDGFMSSIPELAAGEIYLPLGLKSILKCKVGDSIDMVCIDGSHEFRIKGFVQEPTIGAADIGWKQIFISNDDFKQILESCSSLKKEETNIADVTMVMIYQSEDCTLSNAKFQRQLNLETKIITNAIGAMTKSQTIQYSGLLFKIIFNILLVFGGMLFVIVLIVMGHSIANEIEIEYVNLGILKSQGFTKGRIRKILLLQYMFAEMIGIIIGAAGAVVLENILGNIMMENTGILQNSGLSPDKCVILIISILFISATVILICTRKIGRISPVRAISGGKEENYFDSRLNVKISEKALSASLAFRQFTSDKRRYAGSIIIVGILMFFILSVDIIGNIVTSRKALEAMGWEVFDVMVSCLDESSQEYRDEIEKMVESCSRIKKKYYTSSGYMSVNGESIRYDCYEYTEYINAVLKGRVPLYDNEIIISEMVADALDIRMGDEVIVANKDKEAEYIISGIYQTGNDAGMNFAMSFDGARRLGVEYIQYMSFVLEDASKSEEISNMLNDRFGDIILAEPYDTDYYMGSVNSAIHAIRTVIYGFSILFSFVVVSMVCSKTFVREKTDIGIYKALGFTSNTLRLQFALRFFIVALIGAALGTVLSALFSAKLIGLFLMQIGITKIVAVFSVMSVLISIFVMGACFFVFAYLGSQKIRKVEIRELVTE